MNGPSAAVVEEFASAFAQTGRWKGLSKDEILAFFRRYSNNVVDPDFYGLGLTKHKIFYHCLERLHVEDQYSALIDLCGSPPESVNAIPDEQTRQELSNMLHAHAFSNGVSVRAASLDSWAIKREWLKTASRVEKSPAAAVTSARTTLEQTCLEVLRASGSTVRPNDLGKLFKAARRSLSLEGGTDRVAVGVATIVGAIAEASNAAGDRHAGNTPEIPIAEARLMCDVSLALSLFLIDHMKVRPAESSDS